MGDEENINEEQDVIAYLLDRVEENSKRYDDLVEYLERTDPNFERETSTFLDWKHRLEQLRIEEQTQKQIAEARRILENKGYLVAENANCLDAEKIKHWMTTGVDDEDIPF